MGNERKSTTKLFVAERTTALGQNDIFVSRFFNLYDGVLHVGRSDKLPLLDVDDLAGPGRGDQEVRLTAEKCRDLKHVENLGRRSRLRRFMDVGQNGNTDFTPDVGEYFETFFQARPAERMYRCPVRFVVRSFEYVRNVEVLGNLTNLGRHVLGVIRTL